MISIKKYDVKRSTFQKTACFLLGAILVVAGSGHLSWARTEFQAQVPNWVPVDKDLVVILSGIVEILMGLSLLLLYPYLVIVGGVIALFFVLVFPGNISQFTNHLNAFGLNTELKRGFRLLFQPVLVIWSLWSTGAWKYWRKKSNATAVEASVR